MAFCQWQADDDYTCQLCINSKLADALDDGFSTSYLPLFAHRVCHASLSQDTLLLLPELALLVRDRGLLRTLKHSGAAPLRHARPACACAEHFRPERLLTWSSRTPFGEGRSVAYDAS